MPASHVIERGDFDALLGSLSDRGYALIAPTVRDGAIVYDQIAAAADLPVGLTDEQDGGHYRLRARDDQALFGYAVGPHSFKRYQLPAEVKLFSARLQEGGGLTELTEPVAAAVGRLVGAVDREAQELSETAAGPTHS